MAAANKKFLSSATHVIVDCLKYVTSSRRNLVLVHSAMRSGSTLLCALLGMAPDVSHLPEVKFRDIKVRNKWHFFNTAVSNAPEPIVVIKHPIWYSRQKSHWTPPDLSRLRNILLVRDCLPSCISLRNMPKQMTEQAIVEYWHESNRDLHFTMVNSPDQWMLVRYEDLVSDPITVTARAFEFVGSIQKDGVNRYEAPTSFEWKWKHGDGGERIQSLRVQSEQPTGYDPVFSRLIEKSHAVREMRAQLKYNH